MERSTNKFYFWGLGTPIIIITILSMILFYHNFLYVVLSALLSLFIIGFLYKKTRYIPYSKSAYEDLELLHLPLPTEYKVEVYSSQSMSNNKFALRIVELISPYYLKKEPLKAVINKKLYKEFGESFFSIAVTRELEKYKIKYQIKTILRLLLPIFFGIIIALLFQILKGSGILPNSLFIPHFLLPVLLMLLFVTHLYLWNRMMLKMDYQLDENLATFFSLEEIVKYIVVVDKIERGGDKEKYSEVNEHYQKERVKRIKKCKGV